jgi:filamentous hemagglutinin family protein
MKNILLITFLILMVNNVQAQAEEIFLNCSVEGSKLQILPHSSPETHLNRSDVSVQIVVLGKYKSISITGADDYINIVGTKKLTSEFDIEDYSTNQIFNIRNKQITHNNVEANYDRQIELNRVTGQITSSIQSVMVFPGAGPVLQKISLSGLCTKANNRKF